MAIACDGQGLDSAEDSQEKGSLEQKACPSVGTSVLCSNPVKEEDQGTVRARDTATATKQDTSVTKRAVPYPPQSQRASTDFSWEATTTLIHDFLDCFYAKYGSFIPLSNNDVLRHLNKKLNTDLTKGKYFISVVVMKYQAVLAHRMMPAFRVVYNKHTLTLEDLSTLDDQNWLNDQVMNMYGELIMESAQHKVHFFNSFFHRQLMTKGYEGVKRWTRKVDLFSKALLLVPIHLEIHWCLVMADTASKRIHLYDSQGIVFKEAAEVTIPQQTNENDCGVFVLEYCRCLALGKPLQFSQGDMPTVRKRIYRELCECKLQD
uniref:Ubiquitin-like protease family profile domain-containing protein n=1 Tax=Oncorhynchus kisutch TaxID=8019 RepID=A0A8C7KRB5_ONCKI